MSKIVKCRFNGGVGDKTEVLLHSGAKILTAAHNYIHYIKPEGSEGFEKWVINCVETGMMCSSDYEEYVTSVPAPWGIDPIHIFARRIDS